MSSLQIGRLLIAAPLQWFEQTGDPVQTNGGAVVPNTRTAPQYQLSVGTTAADGQTDTRDARLVLRRQLRSLLNNTPLKLQGFLYIVYSDDPDQDGWFVPDQANLQDYSGSSGLATGFWQSQGNWYLVGHPRTHREARQVWMKDLTTGLYARDTLGWIYSTDFSGQTPLAWTAFPNGASGAIDNVTGQAVPFGALEEGSDGGVTEYAAGLPDLATVSFERTEADLNLGDVVVYDRNGDATAPSTGVQDDWDEVYGPDWPWSNPTTDVPQIQNGLCRVRYDGATGQPGFRIDAWVSGAWVEQGKVVFQRDDTSSGGAGTNYLDGLIASGLLEWTPDRAVIQAVMSASADPLSHERILLTLQRGWTGPRIEIYGAPGTDGRTTDTGPVWLYYPAVSDTNDSVSLVGSVSPNMISSAANSAVLPASSFAFVSQNWIHLAREGRSLACVIVLDLPIAINTGNDNEGYGVARNKISNAPDNGGYVSARIGYYAAAAGQINEAEACTLGATASETTDATASGGHAVKETQTAPTNVTITPPAAVIPDATYTLFARVKVDTGATGSFKWGPGTAITSTSTSWTWISLGTADSTIVDNADLLAVQAWRSSGSSGAVYIDRIEVVKLQDAATYDGAVDLGNRALYDSRTLGAIVAR
jgi:hypothetical protein